MISEAGRMSARAGPGRVFFWQGLLILLPVGLMAGIGLMAILRDKAAVERQARARAEEVLGQLAPELGRRFTAELAAFDSCGLEWFEGQRLRLHKERARASGESAANHTNGTGLDSLRLQVWAVPGLPPEAIFPDRLLVRMAGPGALAPGDDQPPRPPDWFLGLAPKPRRAWETLRQAQLAGTNGGKLEAALKGLLDLDPPPDARANAQLLELEREPGRHSVRALRTFAQKHRGTLSEAGLPLSNLALAEALREAGSGPELGTVLDGLVDEVLEGPSLLLPELLDQARAQIAKAARPGDWLDPAEQLWSAQARLRRIASVVRQFDLRAEPTNLWVEAEGRRWFCAVTSTDRADSTNQPSAFHRLAELRVYPKAIVERAVVHALLTPRFTVPGYFGLAVALEGEPLDLRASGVTEAGASRELARVQDSLKLLGSPQWQVRLCLANPAQLFAEQRQRTWLFGGLIIASSLAAILGLAAARGAFYRQLRLSALKSNFVSSVSHELRSPIAAVRLMAESLESGGVADAAKQQQYFRFIGQECRRLSSLIENVLDVARIEQGRKQYDMEPADLEALAQETLSLMEISAIEHRIKLALVIPGNDGLALRTLPEVDGKAIQQALVNLIDNALKHSPQGATVALGVEVLRREGGALDFLLWVEDRGEGIPLEEQERIFERFYRRGSELRRQTQGVGIGLSIVKHIAEGHGGRVRVRSAPGQGSRFTIELPGQDPGGDAAG